jgi:hypothetical protein
MKLQMLDPFLLLAHSGHGGFGLAAVDIRHEFGEWGSLARYMVD